MRIKYEGLKALSDAIQNDVEVLKDATDRNKAKFFKSNLAEEYSAYNICRSLYWDIEFELNNYFTDLTFEHIAEDYTENSDFVINSGTFNKMAEQINEYYSTKERAEYGMRILLNAFDNIDEVLPSDVEQLFLKIIMEFFSTRYDFDMIDYIER